MSKLGDWLKKSTDRVRTEGADGIYWTLMSFYGKVLMKRISENTFNYGVPIFERDWDVLVIVDACRADMMAEVSNEYPFASDNSIDSVASQTGVWHDRNFVDKYRDEMKNTALITSCEHASRRFSDDDFLIFDEVHSYTYDAENRVMPARPLTDRAISVGREHNPDRMIVHYKQPHFPVLPWLPEYGTKTDEKPANWDSIRQGSIIAYWPTIREGDVSLDDAWTGQKENLRFVMDEVELLINNIDAEKLVISSDHGNAFGEYGFYGHPANIPIKALREVPWCITSASDSGEYTPANYDRSKQIENDGYTRDQILKDLGYKI
ncbi:hypothetical protein [Halomicrobium salinisoli]|uniref:hypothetical protein n=1 Tax=Halomicrobium salinisoli TaxID=2878391 RepID=UPI001CEFCDCD|nr:hypothetical protein [Halomicrobium salinisoli]